MSTALAKGQNAPLSVPDVIVSVDVGAPADLSALLVTDAGTVRSDADFVFYNQPSGPGVTLQTGTSPSVRVSTAQVPADIAAVRAVITLDDASSSFGRLAPPVARISDAAGTELYSFAVDGLGPESVVVAVELYRRNGAWKVRAVGQGYAGGFADLVRDHGVSVDDAPAAPPPAPAAPTPPSAPASAPSYPPPAPSPAAAPPPPSAPAPTPEVSLTKNRRVDLTKGQKVTLRKDGGVQLTNIRMGLGWDPVPRRGFGGFGRARDIDLDASVLLFSGGRSVDVVFYGRLRTDDNAIRHSGDNLTGEGEGDDEVINVALQAIPPAIDHLVFIVTSYQGQTFEEVANAYCRLVDDTTGAELARFTLQGGMPYTGVAMAVIAREGGEWKLRALGDGFQAKTPRDALPHLFGYVS